MVGVSAGGRLDPWTVGVRCPADGGGFYESFYVKANHPERKLAVWLKFNLLEPAGGALGGELWGVWFEDGRQVSARASVPVVAAAPGALEVRLGEASLAFTEDGLRESAALGRLAWDVRLTALAAPVLFLPRALYSTPFPRKKILTPIPIGRLSGWVAVDGRPHPVDGWAGFHGHNWGREHAEAYAYGNALFPDGGFADGFSARVRVGPLIAPPASILVVRPPGGGELRFRRGTASWSAYAWRLEANARGARARLEMSAAEADFVTLEYSQPDGRTGLCRNTKFAEAALTVWRDGSVAYSATAASCELETFASA